jgi:hypothetical protein
MVAGLRPEEAKRLEWQDIDVRRKTQPTPGFRQLSLAFCAAKKSTNWSRAIAWLERPSAGNHRAPIARRTCYEFPLEYRGRAPQNWCDKTV